MCRLFGCLGLSLLLWSNVVSAQGNNNNVNNNPPIIVPPTPQPATVGYPGGSMWGWDVAGTSTVGSYLQGLASVVRAEGDYNLATSAAAVNVTAAVHQHIQNQKDFVEAYFAIRAFNRQAYEAEYAREKQLTQEWLRFHPSVKPKRLSPSELDPISGTINWPMLLQSDELTNLRQNIQNAFIQRHQLGTMGYNNYRSVQQNATELLNEMLDRIEHLAPNEYVQAKRFLEALLFEASLPLG
jgi:hypothetical protein